ncbi:Type IV inositol polyphosphate 5-phosphatase 11 [Glycine max]|nr:Type IV inositol polyphosphate 5-phosphatase 11 [Glycine max]
MGNQLSKRRKSRSKTRPMGFIHNQAHIGIRTVGVEKACNFSTNSDLCIPSYLEYEWPELRNSHFNFAMFIYIYFDLLAVGLQEAPPCPRNKVATLLSAALDESHTLIGKVIMQSLQVNLFGPKDAGPFINGEINLHQNRQIIGRKKGTVAIRINYKGFRMVFISCHLSGTNYVPHARKVEERNSQCKHISHFFFSKFWNPYFRPSHITIWLGDLNYRLQGIDTYPARSLIEQDLHPVSSPISSSLHSIQPFIYSFQLNLNILTRQLLQEAGRGQIFNGFCEGTLTFKPTYKYNKGSSNYDTSHKCQHRQTVYCSELKTKITWKQPYIRMSRWMKSTVLIINQ